MAVTMAQALAERIKYQIAAGQKVFDAAGEHHGAVFGSPEDVLTVRGNVSDVAVTNHLWLLDAVAAGTVKGSLPPALDRPRPTSVDAAVEFLAHRETDSAAQAAKRLNEVNSAIAAMVAGLSDAELDKTVDVTFYGPKSLRDLLFIIIEHGSLHLGQAWGILKGKGIAS